MYQGGGQNNGTYIAKGSVEYLHEKCDRAHCQTPWIYGNKKKYAPFQGTRIGELEFANRVVCRVWIKCPVMRIVWIFKICR